MFPPYTEALYDDLFMDADRFQSIVGLLRQNKNLIIQGPPAVGKSLVARRLATALTGDFPSERVEAIQFHPAYGFYDFVHGYRPGMNGMELRDGVFTRFCREALKDPERPYVFIIDEFNRADPAAVFGEVLTLVDPDKRTPYYAMPLLYARLEGERFYVPANVFLIATMNNTDSLRTLDSGVLRRFAAVTLLPAFESVKFIGHLKSFGLPAKSATKLSNTMHKLNLEILELHPGPNAPLIGHGYFRAPQTGVVPGDWATSVAKHFVIPQLLQHWGHSSETWKRFAKLLATL